MADNGDDITTSPSTALAVSAPLLARLATKYRAAVHLMTLDTEGVRFVGGFQVSDESTIQTRTGWVVPAHVSAGGRALLAYAPEAVVAAQFPTGIPLTPNGRIQSMLHLQRELQKIRRRGYARTQGEIDDLVAAIAVPIPHPEHPRYSISIACESPTAMDQHETLAVVDLKATAQEIGEVLQRGAPGS